MKLWQMYKNIKRILLIMKGKTRNYLDLCITPRKWFITFFLSFSLPMLATGLQASELEPLVGTGTDAIDGMVPEADERDEDLSDLKITFRLDCQPEFTAFHKIRYPRWGKGKLRRWKEKQKKKKVEKHLCSNDFDQCEDVT